MDSLLLTVAPVPHVPGAPPAALDVPTDGGAAPAFDLEALVQQLLAGGMVPSDGALVDALPAASTPESEADEEQTGETPTAPVDAAGARATADLAARAIALIVAQLQAQTFPPAQSQEQITSTSAAPSRSVAVALPATAPAPEEAPDAAPAPAESAVSSEPGTPAIVRELSPAQERAAIERLQRVHAPATARIDASAVAERAALPRASGVERALHPDVETTPPVPAAMSGERRSTGEGDALLRPASEGSTAALSAPPTTVPSAPAEMRAPAQAPATPIEAQIARPIIEVISETGDDATLQQTIEVRLDPPSLGRVEISIERSEGRVQVEVRAEHGSTQALLASAAGAIEREVRDRLALPASVMVPYWGGPGSQGGQGDRGGRDERSRADAGADPDEITLTGGSARTGRRTFAGALAALIATRSASAPAGPAEIDAVGQTL